MNSILCNQSPNNGIYALISNHQYGKLEPSAVYFDVPSFYKAQEHTWLEIEEWSELAVKFQNEQGGLARIACVQATYHHKLTVKKKGDSCAVPLPHQLTYEGTLLSLCLDVGHNVPRIQSVSSIADALTVELKKNYPSNYSDDEEWYHIVQRTLLAEILDWSFQRTKSGFLVEAEKMFTSLQIPEEILSTNLCLLEFCCVGRYPPASLYQLSIGERTKGFFIKAKTIMKSAVRALK
jgi:hypothetical protein